MNGIERRKKMVHKKIWQFVKIISFFLVFLVIFSAVQAVLQPNFTYPRTTGGSGDMMTEYYQLDKEIDFQVVFVGSSGFGFDFDPMKIYEDTGIVSYNMATGGQRLPATYALCEEVIRTQKPELIVFDASHLFTKTPNAEQYHFALDYMPFSKTKIELASYYADEFIVNASEDKWFDAFISGIFPFYQYHSRWSSLTKQDFEKEQYGNLFRKGGRLCGETWQTGLTINWMDETLERLMNEDGWKVIYEGGEPTTLSLPPVYTAELIGEYWEMVLKAKKLCEENGVHFLLLKTPHYTKPLSGEYVWTSVKYNIIKDLAEQNGIDYLDLQYDVDLGLDGMTDAGAGTQHLNARGVEKLNNCLEEFIQSQYGIVGHPCEAYDKDVPLYDKAMKVIRLQLTNDLYQYLDAVSNMGNVTVFFSSYDDMATGLSEDICKALNDFGLQTDFSQLQYSDAYFAVVENGNVRDEAYSNRALEGGGKLENGLHYSITSQGYLIEPKSNIIIDNVEYSPMKRGINIVVLDNESSIVLDKVTFDTHDAAHATVARRTGGTADTSYWKYDEYLRLNWNQT